MRQNADLLALACRRLVSLGMPACIKDSSLRYVAVNEAYAALYGAEVAAFVDRTANDITGDAVLAARDESERRAIVFGEDACIDFPTPEGQLYTLSVEQFITDDGQIYIYETFEIQKPAEQFHLEAANDSTSRDDLTALKTMLDALPRPLVLKDADGEVVFANDAYLETSHTADNLASKATEPRQQGLHDILEVAADHIDAGLMIIDPDDRIAYRNESFSRLYGMRGEDVKVGEPFIAFLHRVAEKNRIEGVIKGNKQSIDNWIQSVMRDYKQPQHERLVETRDGRWIKIVNRRMPSGHLVGLRIDVTEGKKREALLIEQNNEILLYKAILDGLPIPVFARDQNHLMVYANAAALTMAGKTIDEIAGRGETAVFGDVADEFYEENKEILETGRLSVKERKNPHAADKLSFILSHKIRVIMPNDKRYVIGSMIDVSDLKMRERELFEAHKAAEAVKADVLEIMNSVPYAVLVIRQSDLIIEMANEVIQADWKNTRVAGLIGHNFLELIDYHFKDVIGDAEQEDYKRIRQNWIESIKSGRVESREATLKSGLCLQIRGGQISGDRALVTFNDVTELRARDREINEARNRLAETGELMNEALVSMDQGLLLLSGEEITLCNDAVGRVLKLPTELTRIGATWPEAFAYCSARGDFGDDPITMLQSFRARSAAGEVVDHTFSVGGESWVRLESRSAGANRSVVLLTDVTELRNRQAELEKLVVRAEKADRAKSEFLAHVSHEIRTPMNGVLGMAELLGRSDLDTRQKTFVGAIAKSGKSLLTVINDILKFSQIETGSLEPLLSNFDPLDSVDDMAAMIVAKAEEKDIEIVVRHALDVPLRVRGDGPRFRQIIYKLIDNAVKFTEHGCVDILLTNGEPIGERPTLCLVVSDTGIGIPAERLETIFETFFRADGVSRSGNEGMGLGLAIAGGLVRLLGGVISVKSTPGKGSSFTVTLPFDVVEAHQQPANIPADSQGARILVIDSAPANRDAMTELLTSWGFDASGAASAAEGLAVLEAADALQMSIDAALVSSRMLEGRGREFGEALRDHESFKNLPIILMTPSNPADVQTITGLNMQAHLLKPVRSSLLLNTVSDVLSSKRHRQASSRSVVHVKRQLAPNLRQNEGLPLEVLIAEDNDINIQVYTQILQMTKCRFKIVRDGMEAITAWHEERPLVVVMDVNMPLLDGFEATRIIRKEEEKSGRLRTPIIGISSHTSNVDRMACLDVGMDDYLPKPINPDRLSEKLADWLRIVRKDEGEDRTSNVSQ